MLYAPLFDSDVLMPALRLSKRMKNGKGAIFLTIRNRFIDPYRRKLSHTIISIDIDDVDSYDILMSSTQSENH